MTQNSLNLFQDVQFYYKNSQSPSGRMCQKRHVFEMFEITHFHLSRHRFWASRLSPFNSPWDYTLKQWSQFYPSSILKFFDFGSQKGLYGPSRGLNINLGRRDYHYSIRREILLWNGGLTFLRAQIKYFWFLALIRPLWPISGSKHRNRALRLSPLDSPWNFTLKRLSNFSPS